MSAAGATAGGGASGGAAGAAGVGSSGGAHGNAGQGGGSSGAGPGAVTATGSQLSAGSSQVLAPAAPATVSSIQDQAGAGLSLLDTVLHQRVDEAGIVTKTVTRILLAMKLSSAPTAAKDICNLISAFLSDIADLEVTGLMVVQAGSLLNFVEASPEGIVALVHFLQQELERRESIVQGRIVAVTEDCPSRCFGPWCYRSVSLPSESGDIDLDSEDMTATCSTVFRNIQQIGIQVQTENAVAAQMALVGVQVDNGDVLLDQLQDKFKAQLTSDKRTQALCKSDKLFSFQEWLEVYDSPLLVNPAEEEVWPLSPRLVY